MRKIILFSLFVFFLLTSSCRSLPALQSTWNRSSSFYNTLADVEANIFFSEDELSLKLSNNSDYIDIILATNSSLTLNKIYNLGLSIWLDPKGKNRQIFGVNFPLSVDKSFSPTVFENYIKRFKNNELQEELFDRFQKYEYEDIRLRENICVSTLDQDEACQVRLSSTDKILFSYHIRLSLKKLMGADFVISNKDKVGVCIFSTDMANEAYRSSLSSRDVINKKLNNLKAGDDSYRKELVEKWVCFNLATND